MNFHSHFTPSSSYFAFKAFSDYWPKKKFITYRIFEGFIGAGHKNPTLTFKTAYYPRLVEYQFLASVAWHNSYHWYKGPLQDYEQALGPLK